VLVVRHDGNHSDLLYHVPTATFQAYNNNGEKSLYSYASGAPNTITGATRAIEVDFDRPYAQPPSGAAAHDWYTRTDVATVSWLEQQGYDIGYIASEDFNAHGDQLTDHKVVLFGSHDEYWSQQMYDAALAARNAGTSLIFLGANSAY
jgi:hypothetical protein